MKHFAKIGDGNIVENVIVGDGISEDWLTANLGGKWVETSFTGEFRGVYAGIGYAYDEALDQFIAPMVPNETV